MIVSCHVQQLQSTPQWFDREALMAEATRRIRATEVVLDIGCGVAPERFFRPSLHICCEPFAEYVRALNHEFCRHPGFVVIQATALELLPLLPDKSVDSIFILDVIEHLDKQAGHRLLQACDRVARCQIVVFTPLGFLPQPYEHDDDVDAWGFRGGKWQRHVSGWEPADFDDTWEVLACRDYHPARTIGATRVPPGGAMWAIRTLLDEADAAMPGTVTTQGVHAAAVLPARGMTPDHVPGLLNLLRREGTTNCTVIGTVDDSWFHATAHQQYLDQRITLGATGQVPQVTFPLASRRLLPEYRWNEPSPAWSRWLPHPWAGHEYRGRLDFRARQIAQVLQQDQCHCVVAMFGDTLDLPAAGRAATKLQLPFIAYAHNSVAVAQSTGGTGPAYQAHLRALRSASAIVAADAETAAAIDRLYGLAAILGEAASGASSTATVDVRTSDSPLRTSALTSIAQAASI
jgi:hypothetical protein